MDLLIQRYLLNDQDLDLLFANLHFQLPFL